MSKGGSTTNSTEIPAWLEDAAKENINKGRDVSSIGYTPYYGPEVAAFNPMQQQSMQSTANAAGAFGLYEPSPNERRNMWQDTLSGQSSMASDGSITRQMGGAPRFDGMAGMPQAQTFAGGVQGYSSAPMFEQALSSLQQNRPGQFEAISNMFIDPFTGSAASNGSSSSNAYANSPEQMNQMFSNSPTNFSQGGGNTSQGNQGGGSSSSFDSSGYDRFPADNAGGFDYNNDMFTRSATGAYYPIQEQAQLKDMMGMGGGLPGLMGDMLGGDSNIVGGALSAYADMSPMSDFVNQVQYGMNKGSMQQYQAMSKANPNWAGMSEFDKVDAAKKAYQAGTALPTPTAQVNVAPTPYQGGGIDPQSYISSGYDRFPNVEVTPLANNNIEALDLMSMLDMEISQEELDYRTQQEAAKKRMAAEKLRQASQSSKSDSKKPAPATGSSWTQKSPGSGGSYSGKGDSYDPSGRF